MFSQTVEYALRAAVAIARHDAGPLAGREIARTTQVPSHYLTKVLAQMIKAGLLHGTRGVGGGYTLAKPAKRIRVLDVVNAIEPIRRIKSCPLASPGRCSELCALHHELDQAIAGVEQTLAHRTLADMAVPKPAPLQQAPTINLRP